MKNLLLLFVPLLLAELSTAQVCGNPQSQIDIHGNNIKARILNGGDLFTDLSSGQFFPNPDPNSADNPSTIYTAGFWMGGVDPGGNLKLATVDYRVDNKYDFTAGPLTPEGITTEFTCSNWDRHFRVTGSEIHDFIGALPLSPAEITTQFPDIAGWPGRGNPLFAGIQGFDLPNTGQGLAPFFDANSDGLYNPIDGDYPAVLLRGLAPFVPAEIVWCVFNDQNGGAPHTNSLGKAIQAEIQLTVWAFNCPDQPILNNTLFTSHLIINRSTESLSSAHFGFWVDIDLGCYLDDYAGSNPTLNTMYAYNQDAVDGQPGTSCQGVATFPGAAPVQSITMLNHPMSNVIMPVNGSVGSPQPGTTDPETPLEFYNYLSGHWRDGASITYGGNGYGGTTPTTHMFPSDPAEPNGWSMCTESLPFSDRRMVGTTAIGEFQAGQVEELVTAWAYHPNPALPCGIGSATSDVIELQELYNNGFAGICSPLKAPELPDDSISLFPNPTADAALLQYGNLTPLALRAYDAAGKLVLEKLGTFEKTATEINTSTFAAGIYSLQIVTEQGIATKKLVVVR